MEKKIVVPEGMLEAVRLKMDSLPTGWALCRRSLAETAINEALRWLSDNPVELSEPVFSKLSDKFSPHRFLVDYGWSQISDEIQRLMFVEVEPEIGEHAKGIIRRMRGCTLTPAEADAIVEEIRYVAHGWTLPVTK